MLQSAQVKVLAELPSYDGAALKSVPSETPLLLLYGAGPNTEAALRDIELFKQDQPGAKVALLTQNYESTAALAAFAADVNAYLSRESSWDTIFKSLELVMLGEAVFPWQLFTGVLKTNSFGVPSPTRRPHDSAARLSPQETAIIRYLAEGSSNKAIARKAAISEATVKVHVKAILRKIRAQNRTQAAIWAIQNVIQDGASGLDKFEACPRSALVRSTAS